MRHWLISLALLPILGACSVGSGAEEYEAAAVCEDFVKDRLKAPATADFGGTSRSGAGSSFTITGHVDSENGFGANVRAHYTCRVHLSDGTWYLDSLDIN